MEFFIEAFGVKRVQTQFNRVGVASINARPAMSAVAEVIFRIESAVFDSQGRRGGGSWKRDSPDWLARKMREGLDPRINHATLALRRSVTERGNENMILETTPSSLRFGSRLPYAPVTQRNRPIIKFSRNDKAMMRGIIRDFLMAAWRAA